MKRRERKRMDKIQKGNTEKELERHRKRFMTFITTDRLKGKRRRCGNIFKRCVYMCVCVRERKKEEGGGGGGRGGREKKQ